MPNIQQEFRDIHLRLTKMEQEVSKCRSLDGFSARTKFEQLLKRVEEVHQQVSEWQAEETKAEAKTNAQQEIRDVSVVLLNNIKALEARHDRLLNSVIRLWTRSEKFLSVLVPAARALDLFKANGWKTRRAQQVLAQLVGRLEKLERRGFWRKIWRFISGRRRHSDTARVRGRDYLRPTVGR